MLDLEKEENLAWLYCDDVYNWPVCVQWRLNEKIANLHDNFGDEGFDNEEIRGEGNARRS